MTLAEQVANWAKTGEATFFKAEDNRDNFEREQENERFWREYER